jgi:hypothetical protein
LPLPAGFVSVFAAGCAGAAWAGAVCVSGLGAVTTLAGPAAGADVVVTAGPEQATTSGTSEIRSKRRMVESLVFVLNPQPA